MVFSAFSSHLSELITLVEEVAFGKLNVRLAKHLHEQRDENNILISTHQNTAAREVISRQLKDKEHIESLVAKLK